LVTFGSSRRSSPRLTNSFICPRPDAGNPDDGRRARIWMRAP
jgi:hypothetical protein